MSDGGAQAHLSRKRHSAEMPIEQPTKFELIVNL